MGALRGFGAGVLTLTLLEAAVSSDKAASNTSGGLTLVAGALARILDPAVPLIPDRRSKVQGEGGNPVILAN